MADLLDQIHAASTQKPPAGGDLLDQVHAAGPKPTEPPKHTAGDYIWDAAKAAWEWTGKPVMDLMGGASRDPERGKKAIETAKGLAMGIVNEPARISDALTKTGAAMVKGDVGGSAYELAGAMPIFGPMVHQITDDVSRGDYGAAVGHAGAVLAPGAKKPVTAAVRKTAGKLTPKGPIVKSKLNPVEQGAVDFLEQKDVPLTVGTKTGNRFVKAAQATTQNSPVGSPAGTDFNLGTEAGLKRVAGDLADEAHPNPATPESAGRGVPARLEKNIEGLALEERAAYKEAWSGQSDPRNTFNVPVRTDKNGGRTMKKVNMPVDVRDIKELAEPVFQSMQWLPAAERSASAAYQAVKVILEGDDFIPAVQAERGLSGLKTMARIDNPNLRDTAQGTAASIIPKLQENIDVAVAATGQDAIRGLMKGRASHASKMEIADVAKQLREEPVQAFEQLVWRNDTGVDFLQTIQKHAPDQMAPIGRAFVQQLVEKATEGGGFNKTGTLLSKWNDLGPETKKILFPDPELRANLGKFLKGADMVSQNPNPSGTALVQSATSINPMRWAAGYLGSKLFFTPKGIALLTDSLQPKSAGAAALTKAQILKMAGTATAPGAFQAASERNKKAIAERKAKLKGASQ
jgi:hypothetical protein